ncbi:hypothetical protein PVAG01_02263 [Phlyctema vagabunda]|uniref:DUF5672 domain-containing protein n=1 Tax=Phlyctema vagabunda TaxID=108571 RepID=A0ABR4PQ56_9HELO
MATPMNTEDRKRRNRNIVFAAFLSLLLIWTIKLSFPQHTVVSVYSGYTGDAESTSLKGSVPHGPGGLVSIPSSKTGGVQMPKPKATSIAAPKNDLTIPGVSVVEAGDTFGGNITTKAAVLVETRFRMNLIPLILHFSTVLGSDWPILIYTSAEAVGQFSTSAALSRHLRQGTIQIRILPSSVLFTNSNSVNEFMTKTWLWESLAPAENILIFQSDSMLCANAARSVDDFFAYDFVGAPIRADLGHGYNGGLSLRKRSSTLRILDEWDWLTTQKSGDRFEDQWFYNRLLILQQRDEEAGIDPTDEGAINLPTMEVARTFSVETIDFPHPLGVHQVHRWMGEGMVSLDDWCPEYKLCSTDPIKDT